MNILKVDVEGTVFCKSIFYTAVDTVNGEFTFQVGKNELISEIDGSAWGITYLLSMYDRIDRREKKCVEIKSISVDGNSASILDIGKKSCYIDEKNPFFNSKKAIYSLVKKHLFQSKIPYTAENVLDMFGVESPYHDRCIAMLGNTKLQAMAAVAFAAGKDIFCFPWLSSKRYNYYATRIDFVANVLAERGKIVILPHS